MSRLTLLLLDGLQRQCIEDVASLSASDASGQFGLLPGHELLVTALTPGLLRYRLGDASEHYLACAGGLLWCQANRISLVSARFILGDDAAALVPQLARQLRQERRSHQGEQQSRAQLERNLMKRLREWSEAAR